MSLESRAPRCLLRRLIKNSVSMSARLAAAHARIAKAGVYQFLAACAVGFACGSLAVNLQIKHDQDREFSSGGNYFEAHVSNTADYKPVVERARSVRRSDGGHTLC